MKKPNVEEAELFYIEHEEKSFFRELIEFICSGSIVFLVLEGENAISEVRKINGATNPAKADVGTIRYLFGKSITENSVHSSDSSKSAEREIAFFFEKEELLKRERE